MTPPLLAPSSPRVAIVGSGPTGLYTLARLLDAPSPLAVTMFERQSGAGWGTPYAPNLNDPAMLANIASVEIPPLTEPLVAWLSRQDDADLQRLGVPRGNIGERVFYPRVVLGAYFRAQLLALVEAAEARGHRVEVMTGRQVADVALGPAEVRLSVEGPDGAEAHAFDHVVLATGHDWPDHPDAPPGWFDSPYPTAALRSLRGRRIGILGSSLSAIDAVAAAAAASGAFLRDASGTLIYVAAADADGFHATLMSRKGLLPEADFHSPIPYEPLAILNPAAAEALVASGRPDLLDAAFELFREELTAADPDYAASIGLAGLDADSFAEAYFAERVAADPFAWAARNLAEAQANYAAGHTVAWRYAILRMHEVVGEIVPHLSAEDLARFDRGLKGVFVDDYATVPHESIERLLALRRARRLDVLRLGSDYELAPGPERGATVTASGEATHFDGFVDATGQRPLAAPDLPFPSLLAQGAVRPARGPDGEETGGVDLDEAFRPVSGLGLVRELYCLGLPFLLSRHPFMQGLTCSEELARTVAASILAEVGADAAAA